jgi:hypothetical protein
VLLDGRAASTSSAALDSDRAATFSVSLPAGRDRLRLALGDPRRPAAVLRIDLRSAIAEREALAATQP